MHAVRLALLLAVTGLLAGCLAGPLDVESASTGGTGDYVLRAQVTDEPGGPGIAGATVEVYHTVPCREFLCFTDQSISSDTLTLTSDADGWIEAHIPTSSAAGSYGILVVTAPGFTRETIDEIPLTGDSATVEAPLYRERLTLDLSSVVGPADASGHRAGVGQFHWDAQRAEFGRNDAAREGYAKRAAYVNITITWNNSLTAAGDLGIAIGAHEDDPSIVGDASNDLTPGPQTDELRLTWHDLEHLGARDASGAWVGAGTGSAFVAPGGLPYTLQVEAYFDGDLAKRESPGPGGLIGALGSLVAAALVARRRE